MVEERLFKWGRIAACITPAAWGIFLLVSLSDNPDQWMLAGALMLLLLHVGTVAAPVWLLCAWRRRFMFSRFPWVLAVLNAAALAAGLLFEVPFWSARLGSALPGF
ncbi:hypothetical protein [uncultured Oscillibacter sp.]|uniref:hypothetical protein n=1 Tax=uncultured Oscillibacter sp. TaxID=876091 RepID=UPI0025EF6D08|nr:hypothetical protein [uncultured Oscillibacter sp.]